MIKIFKNLIFGMAMMFVLVSCGSSKQQQQTIFYVKNGNAVLNMNGKEYNICDISEGEWGTRNAGTFYYFENTKTYYAILIDKEGRRKLYSINYDGDKAKIKLLIDSKHDFNNEFQILYFYDDKIYLVETIEKSEDSLEALASIYCIEKEQLNCLYKDIEIKDKRLDHVYYSKNTDTIFIAESDGWTSSISSIKNGEKKLIDNHIVGGDYARDQIVSTAYGIYYCSHGMDSTMYYDTEEHVAVDNEFINFFIDDRIRNYFYVCTYSDRHGVANLNDYIDFSTATGSEVENELKEIDIEHFDWMGYRTYYIDKTNGKSKLLANGVYNEHYFIQDIMREFYDKTGYFNFMTLKAKETEKATWNQVEEFVKNKYPNYKYDTKGKLRVFMQHNVYQSPNCVFLYKGNLGTWLNFDDEFVRQVDYFTVTKDKKCVVSSSGKLYMGDLNYNEVSNLKCIDNDEEYGRVESYGDKIFVSKDYEISGYPAKYNYDWFEIKDNQVKELEIDKENGIDLTHDIYDNLFLYDAKEKSIKKYNDDKLEVIVNGNIDRMFKIIYCNDKDDVEKENFKKANSYETNPDEHIKDDKVSKEESADNTSGTHENKDSEQNKDKQSSKTSGPVIKNYKKLSANYIKNSEKYKVKNIKKIDDISFYIEDRKLYAKINDKATLLGAHTSEGNSQKWNRLPELICYDELNDVYYYDVECSGQRKERKFNIYKFKINEKGEVDNALNKSLSIDSEIVFSSEYMRYLGDFGKNSAFVTRDYKLYVVRDGKTTLFEDIGKDGWWDVENYYVDGRIAINSFEKKLYYLKDEELYEVDENLNKNLISKDVNSFIALQGELFYNTNFLYRYSNKQSERIIKANFVTFAGKHNDTKCYINIGIIVGKNGAVHSSLYLYEGGQFTIIYDKGIIAGANNSEPKHVGNNNDKFLAYEFEGKKRYALLIDNYDIYRTEVNSEYVIDDIKDLVIGDGYASYRYITDKYEIFFGDNADKKERPVEKKKNDKVKELPIVKMGNNLY